MSTTGLRDRGARLAERPEDEPQLGAAVTRFPCPYLQGEVELTSERESHIAEHHPDLLPTHRGRLSSVLCDPDQVRRSARVGNARMFSRWYGDLRGGKHVVAIVLSESGPKGRHWIVTAYVARRLAGGEIEWKKN